MANEGKAERRLRSWKVPAAIGYIVIVSTFVVLGGWSALARLDAAVVAPGTLIVASNRKTIQHLEGGIVAAVLVREGERVAAGQPLFRLDTTQSQANYDVQRNQLDTHLMLEARLVAERDEKPSFDPPESLSDLDRSQTKRIYQDQLKQFESRRGALQGQVSILESRVEQFKTEISGLTLEREGTQGQLKFIEQELSDLHYLLDKALVPKSRVLVLEREKSRLDGVVGRTTADIAKAENNIGEAHLQITQLRQKFFDDVNTQITETRAKIADLREKVAVAYDVLQRAVITAPISGTIQNQKVFTTGGVIRPGEPLLDIAPDERQMIVQARVSPLDIERIHVGMRSEVRFSAFHSSILPVSFGEVTTISGDRLIDETNKQPYFLAQVVTDDSTVPLEIRDRLTAGMPADIIIATGERTVLNYLVRPLKDRLTKSMREK